MKFSEWLHSPLALHSGFSEYCRFKRYEETGQADYVVEMARIPIEGRAEVRKTSHMLDAAMLFMLAQLPQTLWSQALVYLCDRGLHNLLQGLKAAGIQPLRRTNTPEGSPEEIQNYLGGTGGTEEEQRHYEMIRTHLKEMPPYDFVTFGSGADAHTFFIANHPNVNVSPLAYMFMKIDNSVNDSWFREKKTRTREERRDYMSQMLLKNHGLHGDYFGTFDPTTDGRSETDQYHLWTGYTGLSPAESSKWLQTYFDNLHWYHISQNPNIDDPQAAEARRQHFETASKNPALMHPRLKTGGRPPRRQTLVPVYSGQPLMTHLQVLNRRRNQVARKIPGDKLKKWHIEFYPDGTSNIEIGAQQNYREQYRHAKIDPGQAATIHTLLSDPETSRRAAEAQQTVPEYVAAKVQLKRKNAAQLVANIMADDRVHDAAVYPYWDKEGNLHSSKGGIRKYVQAMPLHAPQKLIPRNVYDSHRYGHQLWVWVVDDILRNDDDYHMFAKLLQNLPPIDDPSLVKSYMSYVKGADGDRTEWPPEDVIQELKAAGVVLESVMLEDDEELERAVSDKKKERHKDWSGVLKGLELAYTARAFKYWLYHERQPPLEPGQTMPGLIKGLLKEFRDAQQQKADEVVKGATPYDLFDYHLEMQHSKIKDVKQLPRAVGGRSPHSGNPLTIHPSEEQLAELKRIMSTHEDETYLDYVLHGVIRFLRSSMVKKNRSNAQIVYDNRHLVTREAMSELLHTKGGLPFVSDFLNARLDIQAQNGKFDPATGSVSGLAADHPALKEYEQAREELRKGFDNIGYQFAERIWQLDLGWGSEGSRRAVKAGKGRKEVAGGEQAVDQEEKDYGAIGAIFTRYEPRSIEERGSEKSGQIFGTGLRRRRSMAEDVAKKLSAEDEAAEQALGVKKQAMSPQEKSMFKRFALGLRLNVLDSRYKGIAYVAAAAKRAYYNELERSGMLASMPPERVSEEMEKAAIRKIREYLDNLRRVYAGDVNEAEIIKSLGQTWKDLNPPNKSGAERLSEQGRVVSDIIYHIESEFFDEKGHFITYKEKAFIDYLKKMEGIAHFNRRQDVPDIKKEEHELSAAYHFVRAEVAKLKAAGSEEMGPMKSAMLKLVSAYADRMKHHISVVAGEKKKYMLDDLETLTNPAVLNNEEWAEEALEILDSRTHHGYKVPKSVYLEYLPKIAHALRVALPKINSKLQDKFQDVMRKLVHSGDEDVVAALRKLAA